MIHRISGIYRQYIDWDKVLELAWKGGQTITIKGEIMKDTREYGITLIHSGECKL